MCKSKKDWTRNKVIEKLSLKETFKDSKVSKKKPLPFEWKKIDAFFNWFDAEGAKELLWSMLKLALNNDVQQPEAKESSNMIFFYKHTKELFDVVHELLAKKQEKYSSFFNL